MGLARKLQHVLDSLTAFKTPEGDIYVSCKSTNSVQTLGLNSETFETWLFNRCYSDGYYIPKDSELRDLYNVLKAKAYTSAERPVYTRVAGCRDRILIDIGDRDWNVIEITANGWRVCQCQDVAFVRPSGLLSLPMPSTNGSFEPLRTLLNLKTDEAWISTIAFCIGAYQPNGPFTHLYISSEQGKGKTGATRRIRQLQTRTRCHSLLHLGMSKI